MKRNISKEIFKEFADNKEAFLVYLSIETLIEDKEDVFVSLWQVAYLLLGNLNYSDTFINGIKNGLDYLISSRLINVKAENKGNYVVRNIIKFRRLDYEKNVYICDLDIIKKILSISAKRKDIIMAYMYCFLENNIKESMTIGSISKSLIANECKIAYKSVVKYLDCLRVSDCIYIKEVKGRIVYSTQREVIDSYNSTFSQSAEANNKRRYKQIYNKIYVAFSKDNKSVKALAREYVEKYDDVYIIKRMLNYIASREEIPEGLVIELNEFLSIENIFDTI